MPRKSYADYDKPGEAECFEDRHFSGVFGEYLRQSDEVALTQLLGDGFESVLDVGAGSGRISNFLAGTRAGRVVAADASVAMLKMAAERSRFLDRPEFVHADARCLPFGDREFDYVISFRTLMHLPDWQGALEQMCRVSRKAVIVDVPARIAAPGLEATFHYMLHCIGSTTAPYKTFTKRELTRAFAAYGFSIDYSVRNFVLPVKFCRLMGNDRLPVKLEQLFRKVRLSKMLGGQLLVRAVRVRDACIPSVHV